MLRRNFLTGLLVTLPIAAALYIFVGIVRSVDGVLPQELVQRKIGYPVPGLGFIAAMILVLLVGAVARNFLGQRLVTIIEHGLGRIPVFGKTYGLLKQIVEVVFGKQGEAFRRAVLVRFPHADAWSVGFVAGTDLEVEARIGRKVLAVYVPTTPNPTSGYYLWVAEEQTIPLDMGIDQALKLIVTMGIAKTESGMIHLSKLAGKPG